MPDLRGRAIAEPRQERPLAMKTIEVPEQSKAATVTNALAVLLDERAGSLHQLAERLRSFAPGGQLPAHRVLALAGQVLAQLGELEAATHRLGTWLEPTP